MAQNASMSRRTVPEAAVEMLQVLVAIVLGVVGSLWEIGTAFVGSASAEA
jgi:hypothetical protein